MKAKVTLKSEYGNGQIIKDEVEFDTIGEIEHYLAYNRAYILKIQFVGVLTVDR